MIGWVEYAINQLVHPEFVSVLPTHIFNPEKRYMYQGNNIQKFTPLSGKSLTKSHENLRKSKQVIEETIAGFDVLQGNE